MGPNKDEMSKGWHTGMHAFLQSLKIALLGSVFQVFPPWYKH